MNFCPYIVCYPIQSFVVGGVGQTFPLRSTDHFQYTILIAVEWKGSALQDSLHVVIALSDVKLVILCWGGF